MTTTQRKETELGLIPQEWEVGPIGNFFTLSQGLQIASVLRIDHPKEGYIPLLKITDLPSKKFSDYVTNIDNQYIASKNDIIYTRTGQVGLVYTNIEGCVHNNCFKINYDCNKYDKRFLYYVFVQKRVFQYANDVATGSVQKDLTHPAFKSCVVAIPPLSEQHAISSILCSLDDKIELLREQNRTLEEIGQTLFKEWFGKYNIKNPERIPDGWRVAKLNDFISISRGLSYKGSGLTDNPEKGIPMINLGSFEITGGYKHSGIKYYSGDYNQKHIKLPGDILICNTDMTQDRAILGRAIMIPNWIGNQVIFTHHVYSVNIISDISKWYLLYALNTPLYREVAEGYATGTTVLNLPSNAILKFPLILPPKEIVNQFDQQISCIYNSQINNEKQIQGLIKIRDSLLPRLMSGKVRVV